MTAQGEFREVRLAEKLVYTWQWAADPDWKNIESLVTIETREKDGKSTELRLTHEKLPSEQSRDNHRGGWSDALLASLDFELQTLCSRLLAAGVPSLWIPKKVQRVDAIPVLTSGKLDLKRSQELASA